MTMISSSFFKTFLLLTLYTVLAVCEKNVLVLVDDLSIQDTHSIFLDTLKQRGYQLTINRADDSSIKLSQYGEYQYQHLILFAPSTDQLGSGLNVKSIVNFIDNGGNVLVAASKDTGDVVRDLMTEIGLEIDEDGTQIVDTVNYDVNDDGSNTLVIAEPQNLLKAKTIVGDATQLKPFLYRGINIVYNGQSPLVLELLSGSSTAKSKSDTKTSDKTLLFATMQARNNARVLVSGSLDFYSNELFKSNVQKSGSDKSYLAGNELLASSLSKWVLKEEGVLRVAEVSHRLADSPNVPEAYTVTDDVIYSIKIEILKDGNWVPFNANDVQLEFVRIDPFVRTTLKKANDQYTVKFKLPDVYGVFKFVVDYNRIGYTYLYSSTQVSVRPLQHTQYERFIQSAYPYYASAFSMMFGTLIFSCVFLYYKDAPRQKPKAE